MVVATLQSACFVIQLILCPFCPFCHPVNPVHCCSQLYFRYKSCKLWFWSILTIAQLYSQVLQKRMQKSCSWSKSEQHVRPSNVHRGKISISGLFAVLKSKTEMIKQHRKEQHRHWTPTRTHMIVQLYILLQQPKSVYMTKHLNV